MAKPTDDVKGYALQVWSAGRWQDWREYQKNGRGHLNREKLRLERLGHRCQVQGLLYEPETKSKKR